MTTHDEAFLAAVRAAYREGETDDAGGVHASTVAERVGCTVRTAERRLHKLAQAGDLQAVHGIGPDGRPRQSFQLRDA